MAGADDAAAWCVLQQVGDDPWLKILGYLDDPKDLCAAACASRSLYRLATCDALWEPLFRGRPESSESEDGAPETSFRERYRLVTGYTRAVTRFHFWLTTINIDKLEQ